MYFRVTTKIWIPIVISIMILMMVVYFVLHDNDNFSVETAEGKTVYENDGFRLVKVSDDIYSFGGYGVFSMIITTDEGVIVIDPISQKHSEAMLQTISAITDRSVKYLIYSHNHWDHTSGG